MYTKKRLAVVPCLDCEQTISLGSGVKHGQIVTCSSCGALLEVVSVEPLELDWAYVDFEADLDMDSDADWEPDAEDWDIVDEN